MVCGKTAGAADSKLLNQSFTSESNRNRPIRILIESQSFTGPYCIISNVSRHVVPPSESISNTAQITVNWNLMTVAFDIMLFFLV